MSTYDQIESCVRSYGIRGLKSCHIADGKAQHGRTTRVAHNRSSRGARVAPCPESKRPYVERALRELGDLK